MSNKQFFNNANFSKSMLQILHQGLLSIDIVFIWFIWVTCKPKDTMVRSDP